jgi:UDP-glucose 4-epimerase/UDP-glucuronate decarboxylase
MNILITGGAGFIGYHLAQHHAGLGDQVFIVDNLFKTEGSTDEDLGLLLARPNVKFLQLDLTELPPDLGSLPRINIVYHLAAINGTRLFYEIPYHLAKTNLLVTLNLLRALEKNAVDRLVYTSTSEAYAGCEQVGLLTIPTNEQTPVVFTQPTDERFSYGTSKFMGECLCLFFGKQFHIPTTVVRYHNIYGPRMGYHHVIPEFILRVRSKENPFHIYGGQETRAFCYVTDAVQATYRVATTSACVNETIHIGDPKEETPIADLAKLVMKQMGESFDIVEGGRRSGSVSRRCPDTSKLKRLTGFEAAVPLEQGLSQTISWYSQQARI